MKAKDMQREEGGMIYLLIVVMLAIFLKWLVSSGMI